MAYESVNPFNGETAQTFDELSGAQLETAISEAAKCFGTWRTWSFSMRSDVVSNAAAILRSDVDRFARPVTEEMGKRIVEARGEVALCADILDYYAQHAETFLAPEVLRPESGEATIANEPIGVLFGVEPWNFPYYQLARFAAPNLMAGNTILLKHAASVPQSAALFETLWSEAGAPVGAYTNLRISYDQVGNVIDDPRVVGVAFTGSSDAGRAIAARAGQNLKKSTMELGGSDAFIVLDDADLDGAVTWAVWAKMNNTGQSCIAAKRFIVMEGLADQFLDKFQAALGALEAGDPMDESTTLAPLSSAAALTKLLGQLDLAVAAGAAIVMGGGRVDVSGAFMQPTILSGITPDNPAYVDEFFGPVALFFRVDNEEDAIALANDTPFGLGGSIFTSDVARGREMASRLDTGMVFINHPTWTAPDLPFGGILNSGYGRELSALGIQEFVNKKLVRIASLDAEP